MASRRSPVAHEQIVVGTVMVAQDLNPIASPGAAPRRL
jgi:hypothetical protein